MDFCTFCFEEVGHFSRHLFRKHKDEEIVKKILGMPVKSCARRMAIVALRKKGNYIWNQEKNELRPVRNRFSQNCKNIDLENQYYPCVTCLGYYKKEYLWRHRKICNSETKNNKNSKTQHLSEAQTFLASTGLLGNYLSKGRLKKEIFSIMRPDAISRTVKTDALICLYGESYLNKHKRKQMHVVVSNRMRELARLKLALQKSSAIVNLIEGLKPEMYEHIVTACKIISGYDSEKNIFQAPSLALHMGTNLKFLCDVARKSVITKSPLFRHLNLEKIGKDILELKEIIKNHWCNDISSLANKVLNENTWEKPKLLPMTEDVQTFNKYIIEMAEESFKKLKNNEDMSFNYKMLAECTLSLVLVFNRKRIGEVQFLDIQTYERNYTATNQTECLNALSEFERKMSNHFKRVVVFGKGSRPVPILFTKKMQTYTEQLIHIRKTTDIVPKSNKYVFANPGVEDKWMCGPAVIRKFAKKCGAKNPELLTSTKFRKQIATILQIINFDQNEMEQVARFMGHTEKTHKEFYRQVQVLMELRLSEMNRDMLNKKLDISLAIVKASSGKRVEIESYRALSAPCFEFLTQDKTVHFRKS